MGKWMCFYLAHVWVPTRMEPANCTHVMLQSKTQKTCGCQGSSRTCSHGGGSWCV